MFKSLDTIGFKMNSIHRHVNRFLANYLKDYNITPEQWTVLKQLGKHNEMTQKEISHLTDKNQATLTRILDILEKKELIERWPNKEDRRSFLIHLNTEGKGLIEKLCPAVEKLYREQILKDIPDEMLGYLSHILSHIRINIMK